MAQYANIKWFEVRRKAIRPSRPRYDPVDDDLNGRVLPFGWWLLPVLLLSLAAWGGIFWLILG